MELGEKLRQARLEAGLSQRALCGEEITRNMLSQIENGSAGPSMGTLKYLAARLGKPVSYFLEEEVPNQTAMEKARAFFDEGCYVEALEALETYRGPDVLFDREKELLFCLAQLGRAEKLLAEGRTLYAGELLEALSTGGVYCSEDLERRRLLLLGRADGLPSLDEELLLRAEGALGAGKPNRAGKLLDAAEDQSTPKWRLLRGRVCLDQGDYAAAAEHFRAAESACPDEVIPKLEQCYRELGDFRMAYEYACKQK